MPDHTLFFALSGPEVDYSIGTSMLTMNTCHI